MKEDLQRLIEIQQIDEEIEAERAEQRALQAELDESRKAVEEAVSKQEESHDFLSDLKKEIDKKNLDVKEQEAFIEKDQTALNTVSSNREYKTLLTDIETRRADLSIVEDELLEAMTHVDEAEKIVKAAEAERQERESELARKESEVKQEVEASDQRISGLDEKKAGTASGIDRELMGTYNRLSGHAEGRAVVPSAGGMCGGCNITLTPQTVSQLIQGDEIVRCLSCGRILYLEDE